MRPTIRPSTIKRRVRRRRGRAPGPNTEAVGYMLIPFIAGTVAFLLVNYLL